MARRPGVRYKRQTVLSHSQGGREIPAPRHSAIYRAVNERIRDVSIWSGASGPVGFLCECGDADCDGVLDLTIPAFEGIRSRLDHFLVLRGHESPDVDEVVAENNGYLIVAKGDAAAP